MNEDSREKLVQWVADSLQIFLNPRILGFFRVFKESEFRSEILINLPHGFMWRGGFGKVNDLLEKRCNDRLLELEQGPKRTKHQMLVKSRSQRLKKLNKLVYLILYKLIEQDIEKMELILTRNQNLVSCGHYNNVCEMISKIKSRSRNVSTSKRRPLKVKSQIGNQKGKNILIDGGIKRNNENLQQKQVRLFFMRRLYIVELCLVFMLERGNFWEHLILSYILKSLLLRYYYYYKYE